MESNDNGRDFEVTRDPAPAAGAKNHGFILYGCSLRYVPPREIGITVATLLMHRHLSILPSEEAVHIYV
jgi:hypothetical protein